MNSKNMELNSKPPFITAEAMRTQRADVYLQDLKQRLKELRLQHDEVIQHSVDIIKELDEVSTTLLSPKVSQTSTSTRQSTDIKSIIQEFEKCKDAKSEKKAPVQLNVDIRKLMSNFEKLNESRVLEDSLLLFKRAKESMDKIDNYIGQIGCAEEEEDPKKVAKKVDFKKKIEMFNRRAEIHSSNSPFTSCCSSVVSLDTFHSTQEFHSPPVIPNKVQVPPGDITSTEGGYEGDNDDSEYDLVALQN